ncbi:MAG TPA: histidine--tRNA ligase [Hanamia sp.]|jgi:histidyl-tRNA synthetase|nr:histidine--tRNA ligase [Hanamia sp.]
MKPTLPQGTRDFAPETLRRRRFIIHTIKEIFELYGFEPLETPSMENLETLMGKYGDEGDKLIFKILNNGLDNPSKRENVIKDFELILSGKNNKNITERALRYDLTIPFARFMAMNQGKLTLPFKRYQIQPVWRADRPQKGRYREFMQCDADVAGTYSLISDVELAEIYSDVFRKLKIDVEIKINSRKILYALAEVCDSIDNMTAITVAIDKLEKIGIEKVKEELKATGLSEKSLSIIENYTKIEGSNSGKLEKLETIIGNSGTGKKGIEELKFVLDFLTNNDSRETNKVILDFTLARGLNYYTGTIYEVKAKNVQIGSIGGGGRYDDLTGLFGVPNMPGVGISFGLDRIYDVMEELNLFPENINQATEVLFFNLGEKESKHAFYLMQKLRHEKISCELFYENVKLDKQFKYATKKNISYAIIIGSKEMEEHNCVIKNLMTGEQKTIQEQELVNFF